MLEDFYYTYVLLCADDMLYIGYTDNLPQRMQAHQDGLVTATKKRRPMRLVYFEACTSQKSAIKREKYFKTGFGRSFLKKRLS